MVEQSSRGEGGLRRVREGQRGGRKGGRRWAATQSMRLAGYELVRMNTCVGSRLGVDRGMPNASARGREEKQRRCLAALES